MLVPLLPSIEEDLALQVLRAAGYRSSFRDVTLEANRPRIQSTPAVTSRRSKALCANPSGALSRRAPKAAQEIGRRHRAGSAFSSLVPVECGQGTTGQGAGPGHRRECGWQRGNSAQLAPLMHRPLAFSPSALSGFPVAARNGPADPIRVAATGRPLRRPLGTSSATTRPFCDAACAT